MKKILYFLLIVVGCKQNDEFKGGRVFNITDKIDTLNKNIDIVIDEKTKKTIDSINKSLDSFYDKNKMNIGPKVKNNFIWE